MISSRIDAGRRESPSRVALTAEIPLADSDLQALLFDLETGRPYLFVDARAQDAGADPYRRALQVSLSVSGEGSGSK
jgi:hypothetical protein